MSRLADEPGVDRLESASGSYEPDLLWRVSCGCRWPEEWIVLGPQLRYACARCGRLMQLEQIFVGVRTYGQSE